MISSSSTTSTRMDERSHVSASVWIRKSGEGAELANVHRAADRLEWAHDHQPPHQNRPAADPGRDRRDPPARPVRRLRQRLRRRRLRPARRGRRLLGVPRRRRRGGPRPRGRDAEVRRVHARARRRHARPLAGRRRPDERRGALRGPDGGRPGRLPEVDGHGRARGRRRGADRGGEAVLPGHGGVHARARLQLPRPRVRRWPGHPEGREGARATFRVRTTRRSRRTWRSAAPRPAWSRRARLAARPTSSRADMSRRSVDWRRGPGVRAHRRRAGRVQRPRHRTTPRTRRARPLPRPPPRCSAPT